MLQVSRRTERRGAGKGELAGLALVLMAGAMTAWWAGQSVSVGVNVSGLNTAARVLGLFDRTHPQRESVGFDPNNPNLAPTTTDAEAGTSPSAAYCLNGQSPQFALGALDLRRQIGEAIGVPLECEHAGSAAGETLQQTTTGLVDYQAGTNTVTFTDGWHHWALTPQGMVAWEGSQSNPPSG
jgi:hypothetical protein